MTRHVLGRLAAAGVLRRAGHRRSVLRVAPRFLAHAEGTAGRLRLDGTPDTRTILEKALATWDEFHGDAARGALYLDELLDERGQLGSLRPSLTLLDRYAVAGA